MKVYPQNQETAGSWPAPIDQIYQSLGGKTATPIAPKLPHLSWADILFLSALMSTPSDLRPWGIVTWAAETFRLSRTTLYELVDRVEAKLNRLEVVQGKSQSLAKAPPVIDVTEARLCRTILHASLVGGMSIRPLRQLLSEAFGQTRSLGWINQLLLQAGKEAKEVLDTIDYSPLGKVIAARDETFFHQQPILLVIDPVSSVILLAEATSDRKADTWGTMLLMAEERGVELIGLVEDMAQMYGKSMEEAEIEIPVQKDIWHITAEGKKLLNRLEKATFASMGKVMKLEQQLLKKWDESRFEKYVEAVAEEERYCDQYDLFAENLSHFVDALELVDWRSGEIREVETNRWLLTEVLKNLSQIEHPKVGKWRKKIERHADQLLTANAWIGKFIEPLRSQLPSVSSQREEKDQFLRLIARHWRLNQAIINGHSAFKELAQEAQQTLEAFVANNPSKEALAKQVMGLFDASGRTSSMIENINSLLKPFLESHQAFSSPETLQLYLNLFVLWHNSRIYERGKRKGKSPYQHAGIELPESDWLTLLGYPAA